MFFEENYRAIRFNGLLEIKKFQFYVVFAVIHDVHNLYIVTDSSLLKAYFFVVFLYFIIMYNSNKNEIPISKSKERILSPYSFR